MEHFNEVNETIKDYLNGLYFCDRDLLETVFHPSAIYVTADEAPMLLRTMKDYFSVVETRQSPSSRFESRADYIDSIELAGNNTAFARVRCSIGPRDFVDFLTLIRTNSGWQIISKVFHFTERQINQ